MALMAGRGVVDESVIERRLRPIYDWLDNGNNKKAMQEADKVLRKQPKLQCAKVLKGLALLRLGRNNECLELIDSVVTDGTSDEPTLQALTICYREMHQPEQICSIYERAAKLNPNNEEIISHLFMAHVRVGDYKKQQMTAMQLYKLKPKNPYYFWAVMSIVMQTQVSKDPAAKKVGLQLAERMVSKFISQDKIDSEAEIMTYLYILETQEKYAEALQVLDGPLAQKIVHQPQNFIPMKKASYHTNLQQFDASSIIYMNLIQHESDNWQHYVNLTETVLRMQEEPIPNLVGQADPLIEASKFLKEIRKEGLKNVHKARSPLLGLLQFALKLKERGLSERIEELCGDLAEQFTEYIKHYSDKMCCFGDIVIFIPLIAPQSKTSILQNMKSLIQNDNNEIPIDIKNIYRHQFYFQLVKSFGLQDTFSYNDHLRFADELVGYYTKCRHLWSDMAATDIRPNDTYMILAAHSFFAAIPHLVSLKANNQDCEISPTVVMVKLCCLLEHAIQVSKANFQMQLLLIKAYNMIGASEVAFSVYEKLDLKHIQMDTLGHILSLQILDTGRFSAADTIFSTTLKFFMANHKDTSDPLILSYKFGSLVKIPEFVDFRNRLNHSLHFATVTAEQMLLELTTRVESTADLSEVIQELEIDHTKDKTDWDNLRDNRDLNVMNSWEPQYSKFDSKLKDETFNGDVALLKIRSLMLRFTAASYQLRKEGTSSNKLKSMTNGDTNGTCDKNTFTDLHLQLHDETTNCDKYFKLQPPQIPLQGPDSPRIFIYSKGCYLPCFLVHADILHFIYCCTEGSQELDAWSIDRLKRAEDCIDGVISSQRGHVINFEGVVLNALPCRNNEPLYHLWHFVQLVTLISIVLECCVALLIPIKNNIQKKNRKKKTNVSLPEIIPSFNSYVASLSKNLHKFETLLNEKMTCCKNSLESNTNSKYSDLPVDIPNLELEVDVAKLCESIERSFLLSLTSIHLLLKSKIKFLSSLKV